MARSMGRLGAGIVVGGLMALGATVAQRELMRRAGTRLIDWEEVRRIARRRLGDAAVIIPPDEHAAATAFYAETLRRIEPAVADAIGAQLPEALETPLVVDRTEWIDLNLATFHQLFGRVEQIVASQQHGPDTPGRALARIVNRRIGNEQLGFLLAFLGRKVLGQYDVSLLAAAPDVRGRLAFVEQNIRATAASLRLPLDEFRTFIALHEATHAFEFEAYPWLRDHFAASIAEAVELFASDTASLGERLRAALGGGEGHWLERIMTPTQRESFHRTQALMALLEGYSNHVMHDAGERILPGFAELHARFERRNEGRGAIERMIMRVTGLDLKMEQYAAGERFVDAVLARRDRAFLNRVWTGPQTLPTLAEIGDPARWVARMDAPVEVSS